MKTDGVSTAFEVILEEIEAVVDQLATEGAAAFRECHYDHADKLSGSGKRLLTFREKLEQLRDEWKSGIDVEVRHRVKVKPGYTISPHKKSPKTGLRVTLPNSHVIQHPNAAETFTDTIKEIGIEKVQKLGLTVYGVPFVDIKKHGKYSQKKCGAYYIITHSSTLDKKDLLEQIGKKLGNSLKVEIV